MRNSAARRRSRGFTLLEVLIAFVIAGLAMGVMFDGVLGGIRATQTASHYQEAVSLARSHLAAASVGLIRRREELGDDGRGFKWRLVIAPAGTVTLARNPAYGNDTGPAVLATLYVISVTESWKGDTGERRVRLDTQRVAPGAATGG